VDDDLYDVADPCDGWDVDDPCDGWTDDEIRANAEDAIADEQIEESKIEHGLQRERIQRERVQRRLRLSRRPLVVARRSRTRARAQRGRRLSVRAASRGSPRRPEDSEPALARRGRWLA
jgi:hypothetical protein